MSQQSLSSRDKMTQRIHRLYADFYKISGGLLLVGFGIWIGSLLFADGYATNVYTEFLSVIATILVLDRLSDWREAQRLKRRLQREAGSQSNKTAKSAIDWMRDEGWLCVDDDVQLLKGADLARANLVGAKLAQANLENVSLIAANLENADLNGANLSEAKIGLAKLVGAILKFANLKDAQLFIANLEDADLREANLMGADLVRSNLKRARLFEANLVRANLSNANLIGTDLVGANLEGANLENSILHGAELWRTNLTNANLRGSDLRGTELLNANLRGANLIGAKLDNVVWTGDLNGEMSPAILPDGSRWTSKTDITRFTNRHHPDFWNPDTD